MMRPKVRGSSLMSLLWLIIDLGERFHRASLSKYEADKNQAVKAAEEALLERAEAFRQNSVAKALQKASAANEKEARKKERAFERKLKV